MEAKSVEESEKSDKRLEVEPIESFERIVHAILAPAR